MMNLKEMAAIQALTYLQDGMILGLGTGSTVKYFIDLLGERCRSQQLKQIRIVPTSQSTAALAQQQGLPLVSLKDFPVLDLAVDGADEVDPQLNLIKGLGRALLREKIVEIHASRFIVIVDESKLVDRLGRGPLPVEILPFEFLAHLRWLNSLGCRAELWLEEDGQPILTDNGNFLARCWFPNGIENAFELARRLNDRPGVIEHGLFLNMASDVIIAGMDGIKYLKKEL